MRTVTTCREYDEAGRLVKETVTEVETHDAPLTVLPGRSSCTCGTTAVCPLHGQRPGVWWTSPVTTCTSGITDSDHTLIPINSAA